MVIEEYEKGTEKCSSCSVRLNGYPRTALQHLSFDVRWPTLEHTTTAGLESIGMEWLSAKVARIDCIDPTAGREGLHLLSFLL